MKTARTAEEIARKNREISRYMVIERVKKIAPLALLALGIFVVLVVRSLDLSHEVGRHDGVVEFSNWKDGAAGLQRIVVTVKLDDGREVTAPGHFPVAPKRGDHVQISDRMSPFGTESYVVVNPGANPG